LKRIDFDEQFEQTVLFGAMRLHFVRIALCGHECYHEIDLIFEIALEKLKNFLHFARIFAVLYEISYVILKNTLLDVENIAGLFVIIQS
jgi:hypothetical protein